jgi:hypothetical protein
MKARTKIIADGLFSLRSKQVVAVKERLRAAAGLRHAQEMKGASVLARMRLKVKMEREVRAELGKLFPPGAFYVATGRVGHD